MLGEPSYRLVIRALAKPSLINRNNVVFLVLLKGF